MTLVERDFCLEREKYIRDIEDKNSLVAKDVNSLQVKTTLETGVEDVKTTLGTGVEAVKTTLQTGKKIDAQPFFRMLSKMNVKHVRRKSPR
jgi:hypothetical protein